MSSTGPVQLRRIFTLDRALRELPYPNVPALAKMTNVNPKTIRRDLIFMKRKMGAPVAFSRERNGWHYTEPSFTLPALVLTEGELLALFLAGQVLTDHAGAPYHTVLKAAIERLAETLPQKATVHWSAVEQSQSYRQTNPVLHDIKMFRKLAEAVWQHQQVEIVYWSVARNQTTKRIVDPWHLTCIDGSWYCLGYCHLRKAPRTFCPNRIKDLKLTGKKFTIPEDFNPKDYFKSAFRVIADKGQPLQRVKLKFEPSATGYITERNWHPTQQQILTPDGGVVLEFDVSSLIEVRRWIMSWGAECQVLEPSELVIDIREQAQAILKQVKPKA